MDPLNALKAVVMGVVEGLTEFLPVSSTGHLIATAELIGFYMDPADQEFRHLFEIVIQLGAILAVLALFRQRVWRVVSTLHSDANSREFVLKLSAAFIPAGIVGFTTHKYIELYLMNTGVVAAMLALGGLLIILLERRKEQPVLYQDAMALPWKIAIGVGCFQCLSLLLPGTSRAAASILGGIFLGLDRRTATEFSFFLAIPTMLAATTYSLLKHHEALHDSRLGILAIGTIVSFIVAWVVIAWLIRFVSSHTFIVFGWYRIAAGLVLAILLASGVISWGGQ
jgi:undecaprenyl-diphosphatase